jgi:hypothetical protein
VFEKFGKGVKGFFGRWVVVVVVAPLHLYDDPFECISSRKVSQQLLAMLLHFIQLVIRLLDEEMELSLPLLYVPKLVYSSDKRGVGFVQDCFVNPLLEGLVRAEEVPLLTRERSMGEENRARPEEAGVNRLSFAESAQDEQVSWGEVVTDILSHDSSICGRQFEVMVEGRVGIIGDPSFSRVVRVLLEEASEAVVGGGRAAPLIFCGAVSGGGRWGWGAIELEGQDSVYCLLLLLSDRSVKRDGGRHG